MLALGGSWLLIRTVFAFPVRATLLQSAREERRALGWTTLSWRPAADYLDFLYYACVIGMTSQVADVAVTSRAMRGLALLHSVVSFGFNLVVIALGMNVVAMIMQ